MLSSRFCSHCGFEAEVGDQVCKVCGAALPAAGGAEAPTLVKTPPAAAPPDPVPFAAIIAATPEPAAANDDAALGTGAIAATPEQSAATTPVAAAAAAPLLPAPPPAAPPPAAPSPWPSAPPAVVPTALAYPPTPALYAQPAQAPLGASVAPGYPAYAQGVYQAAPYGYGASYGYPYGYPYPYPYYFPYTPYPPKKPGETYAKVVSWIVLILGILGVICGIIALLVTLGVLLTGSADNLSTQGALAGFVVGPLVGGALAIYYGLTGILRRPSPSFTLPPAWLIGVLALVAFGAGVILWNIQAAGGATPGAALGVLPLAIFTGVLPAFTILAFTSQRLRNPSSRRHVWMSLLYGLTIAPLLASILELIAAIVLALIFGVNSTILLNNNIATQEPAVLLAIFLELSVVAPLVEEGLKPLGAVLIMRRLRTPGEAFLVGLAGGIGFDMFETVGYIGQGQADWVYVAIERVGAGLLHGVGAGMSALGWYYLINGKGVRLRWLKGVGCGLYAVLQHGIFNGVNLLPYVFPALNQPFSQPLYLGRLPFESEVIMFLVIYGFMLGMLFFITRRVRDAKGQPTPTPTNAPASGVPMPQAPQAPMPQPVGGGVR